MTSRDSGEVVTAVPYSFVSGGGNPNDIETEPISTLQERISTLEETRESRLSEMVRIPSLWLRECFAEFLGTFMLVLFGDGAVAQTVLSDGNAGSYVTHPFAFGIGLFLGIHMSAGVSGGHLNPAVTFTMALFGRFPWVKVPMYFFSQFLGAFFAAFMVYAVYYNKINAKDDFTIATAGIFSTYPSEFVTNGSAFLTEALGAALLIGGIFAVCDKKNTPASDFTKPFSIAIILTGVGFALGSNTGYGINPARDFGPRCLASLAGWGSKVFSTNSHYFWIPIVAPFVGGAVGAGIYEILVEWQHPKH